MNRVVFSVVIAAYNPGERILPTLRSALSQTYRDNEIIVVGDGCSDGTGEIIRSHFGDKVQWKNLDRNSGSQSEPNNEGNRLAEGTHIAYLGHDDIWSPNHLQALAATITSSDPDFAVSGALYHTPEGSDLYFLSGFFEDSSAAAKEFYPPSSFAHRRDILARIGNWPDPRLVNRPVDSDLLLRASGAGCSFASTNRLTVHKFAAGHRYLFYRFPSSVEQEVMLTNLADATFEERFITALIARVAAGAKVHRPTYEDYSVHALGSLYRAARRAKGLEVGVPISIAQATFLALEPGPAALDWELPEPGSFRSAVRWSGANPNPNYLLNVRIAKPFSLRIHIAAFADPATAAALHLKVNGRDAVYVTEATNTRAVVLVARPDLPLPVDNGLRVVFETHRPGSPLPRTVVAGRRFALAGFEIVPDATFTQGTFQQVLRRAIASRRDRRAQ